MENWRVYSEEERYFSEFEEYVSLIGESKTPLNESAMAKILSFFENGIVKAVQSTAKIAARIIRKIGSIVDKIKANKALYTSLKLLLALAAFSVVMSPENAFAAVEWDGAVLGPNAAETNELYTNAIRGGLEIMASAFDDVARADIDHDAKGKFHQILNLISKINQEEVVELTKAEKIYLTFADSILDLCRFTDKELAASGESTGVTKELIHIGEKIKDFTVKDFQKIGTDYNMKYSGELAGQTKGDMVSYIGKDFAKAASEIM